MKIYLSPSNQNGNTYCVKPHTEQEICEEICGYLRDELTRCGIEACGWQPKIAQRIIEANSAAVDLYIAVHSNGHDSTARGVLVLTEHAGAKSLAASTAVYKRLTDIYPDKSLCRGVRDGKFDEILQPRCATVYIETAFHDNPADAQWILANRRQIAAAIAQGVCDYAGIRYVAAAPEHLTPIMGKSVATAAQMRTYLAAKNPTAPDYARLYLSEGKTEGIRGDVAFAQSCIETNYWRFGGDVQPAQNNFAGIGATGNGAAGNSFATPQIGIRAQVQHLKGYASTDALNQECVDPRFKYLANMRGKAAAVEHLGRLENPYNIGWAEGRGYGAAVLKVLAEILATPETAPEPRAYMLDLATLGAQGYDSVTIKL